MSMLSLQIDRLRSYADLYDGTTKPEMAKELQRPYLAQELRKAADTIWELRDDLQRANAENAKLRELVADMWNGMCGYAHECRDCEHYELYEGQRFVGECEYHRRIRELGIGVNDG